MAETLYIDTATIKNDIDVKQIVAFDLDDTLMAEIDFLHSAYRYIAGKIAQRYNECYDTILNVMLTADNAFDALYEYLIAHGYKEVMQPRQMVEIYRNHHPVALPFNNGAVRLLRELQRRGIGIALITDGRINTQTAKIRALRLNRYINPGDIIISAATGHDKTSPHNFELLQSSHPEVSQFYYVGDNTAKDFHHPRRLGWKTIALRDNSARNIHAQDFNVDEKYRPDFIVDNLTDIIDIISAN